MPMLVAVVRSIEGRTGEDRAGDRAHEDHPACVPELLVGHQGSGPTVHPSTGLAQDHRNLHVLTGDETVPSELEQLVGRRPRGSWPAQTD